MDKYLLSILGSSVDSFYESDTYPDVGDFSHARYISTAAGGPPLNVGAICAAKGQSVYALDMLGEEDETTPFLLSELKRLHFNTDPVQIAKGVRNGKVLIFLTGDQRTMFVIDPIRPHYEMSEEIQELLNNATYIYSLMHMISRSFASIDPLFQAKKNGARIILDGSSKYDDPSRVKVLYDLADGLFINETCYQRLKENSPGEPKDIILNNGGEFVIVTQGSKGSTLYLKDREIFRPSVPNLEVIDSTGAGDAFAGCFIACLLKQIPYEKALSYATVNGAYACTVLGGLGGLSSFEDLETFAKEHNYEL